MSESTRTRELELKFETKMLVPEFVTLVKSLIPKCFIDQEIHIPEDIDRYYINREGIVLRHRFSFNKHELTVKSRGDNVYNARDEININLKGEERELVDKFCELAGFKFEFEFTKEIFVFNMMDIQVAYYTVHGSPFQFIELEYIGEGGNEPEQVYINELRKVAVMLSLKDEVKRSIYDIYKEWMECEAVF